MKKINILLVALTSIAFAVVLFFAPAISQPLVYHHFCNENEIFGLHNCFNVISNIGFVVVGFYGLFISNKYFIINDYIKILCIGFILTGIGSAYYHYNPNNTTLVWDRLPMTIVFTTFFAQVYSWYMSKKVAKKIWYILLPLGIFSVWYWYYTETLSKGDLRLYALVQYLPMLLMVIIVALQHKKLKPLTKYFVWVAICYFIAKLFENYDETVFNVTKFVSGHPLKHIAASVATYYIVKLNIIKQKLDYGDL